MHPSVLAERTQLATEKTRAATELLGERFGLEMPVVGARPGNIDPVVSQLYERESVAAFLEQLAEAAVPKAESSKAEAKRS